MGTMRVRDVMTVDVLTVELDTPLKVVAKRLLLARISGAPVVDGGRVVGIVSESDLLPLKEGAPGRPIRVAGDVMTAPVVTLMEDCPIPEAARVLQRHRIKRAPVVRGGHLVGIVTRTDLLRPYLRTDSEIRAEIEGEVLGDGLELSPREIDVTVDGGVVTLVGEVPTPRTRSLAIRLARGVDGVVDVVDRLEAREPAARRALVF